MAITAAGRQQNGTLKTIKASGGDAAITMTSVANGAARQSVLLDLGATYAQLWALQATIEPTSAPTAGNTVDFYISPSDSATPGSLTCGNASGTDAAYTGIATLATSLKLLQFVGSLVVTADNSAQTGHVGTFRPVSRYLNLIVVNNMGVAWVANSTNAKFVLRPLEDTSEAS